jgi:hypothetical protein
VTKYNVFTFLKNKCIIFNDILTYYQIVFDALLLQSQSFQVAPYTFFPRLPRSTSATHSWIFHLGTTLDIIKGGERKGGEETGGEGGSGEKGWRGEGWEGRGREKERRVLSTMKLALQGMQFSAPNCCKTRLRASRILKIFPGVTPPDPHSKGRGGVYLFLIV